MSLGHCSAHSCWEAGPAWHTTSGDQQVNSDCLAGHQGRGDPLMLMAERTCLPTAARLEAVDLLRGPLCPAAPSPGANMSPSEPALPVREEAGMQSRALMHSHASPPAWVCAGLGTPLSASLVPAATLPHQHRRRNLSSRLLIQPPLHSEGERTQRAAPADWGTWVRTGGPGCGHPEAHAEQPCILGPDCPPPRLLLLIPAETP